MHNSIWTVQSEAGIASYDYSHDVIPNNHWWCAHKTKRTSIWRTTQSYNRATALQSLARTVRVVH